MNENRASIEITRPQCWCGDPPSAHECFDGVGSTGYWSIIVCVNCQQISALVPIANHKPRIWLPGYYEPADEEVVNLVN